MIYIFEFHLLSNLMLGLFSFSLLDPKLPPSLCFVTDSFLTSLLLSFLLVLFKGISLFLFLFFICFSLNWLTDLDLAMFCWSLVYLWCVIKTIFFLDGSYSNFFFSMMSLCLELN